MGLFFVAAAAILVRRRNVQFQIGLVIIGKAGDKSKGTLKMHSA
jgi:hypothetical protein